MYRVVIPWSIPNAGVSVSVLHLRELQASNVQDSVNAIRTFFAAQAARIPDNVSLSMPSEVLRIDEDTDTLTGVLTVSPGSVVTGTSTAGWGAGLGARVIWGTPFINRGRRVRGSTFLVPLANTSFDTNGRVADATRTAITANAQTLIDALEVTNAPLGVYSRPITGQVGNLYDVETPSVSPIPGTLRGRKY